MFINKTGTFSASHWTFCFKCVSKHARSIVILFWRIAASDISSELYIAIALNPLPNKSKERENIRTYQIVLIISVVREYLRIHTFTFVFSLICTAQLIGLEGCDLWTYTFLLGTYHVSSNYVLR